MEKNMNKEKINEALKTIIDPELFIDIITLGLVYDIEENNGDIKITMTLTSPMCPYGPELLENIKLIILTPII
jgi:metal-sulfur cluster biosynthetic enzyme